MTTTQSNLAAKTAEAAQQYALKNYTEAADLYSEASSLQSELNGEMAAENAELLYAYGRCLYKVAIEKSDVLGGKVAGPSTGGGESGKQPRGKKRKAQGGDEDAGERVAAAAPKAGTQAVASAAMKENAPYFQIEGDDPDWDSEESGEGEGEEEDAKATAQEEEEEDDLATAYEVLDIARVLLIKRLEALDDDTTLSTAADTQPQDGASATGTANGTMSAKGKDKGKGKAAAAVISPTTTISVTSPTVSLTSDPTKRHIQEVLADTYDLQSEISLENERFPEAAADARASLALKLVLYPFDSSFVNEAHYKLSLALEFAAKTTTEKPDELTGELRREVEGVDEEMMRESARHMELAIESTRKRVEKEGREAEECMDKAEKQKKLKAVQEVREIMVDMEERLTDLRSTPTALSTAALDDPFAPSTNPIATGLLGALLGESPAVARERIVEATKTATDLTGLVRHRKKSAENGTINNGAGGAAAGGSAPVQGQGQNQGKRKAPGRESEHEQGQGVVNGKNKRARVEDAKDGVDELA